MTVFYTADTHIGHRAVAARRGFASVAEHDETVTARWNATVSPGDVVWHLGDVGMWDPAVFLPVIAGLNGVKHLITGNHDAPWPGHRDAHKHQRAWLDVFASVQPFARRRIAGRDVLLSHFPYRGDSGPLDRAAAYRLRDEGMWLLHGHTHSPAKYGEFPRQLHVGVDAWGLAPVAEHVIGRELPGG